MCSKQMQCSYSRLYKRKKKKAFADFLMNKCKEGMKKSSPKLRYFLLNVCMLAFLLFLKHVVDS